MPWSPFYRWVNKGSEKLSELAPSHKVRKSCQNPDFKPGVADHKAQSRLFMTHPKHRPEATSLILSSGQTRGRENPCTSWGPGTEELPISSCQCLGHTKQWSVCTGDIWRKGIYSESWGTSGTSEVCEEVLWGPDKLKELPCSCLGLCPTLPNFSDSMASPFPFLTARDKQWRVWILTQRLTWGTLQSQKGDIYVRKLKVT